MSWQRKVVIRILLLLAKMIEPEPDLKRDIAALAMHIDVWAPKE